MRDFFKPGRSAVMAENGMAATSHPLATIAALDMLKEGGNAVDAALCAAATLSVVEPHMSGIGGDCFAILAEPDGTLHGLNGSGRAGAAATPEWYRARGFATMPQTGAPTVTVPGALGAWEALRQQFGTCGFDRLFSPAIRYAEEGFAVHPRVAWDFERYAAAMSADEGGRLHYYRDGEPKRAGERLRLPALAGTLRAIADTGVEAFYSGPIAAEIAATVQTNGGMLTEEDIAGARADWVAPIGISYGGHEVMEIPPNGQGITALILLGIMQRIGAGRLPPDSAERWHAEIEAGRLAYAVRDHLVADAAAMTVSPSELLSSVYLDRLAAQFDPARRNPDIRLPQHAAASTTYLSVVDRDRLAVSFICSLYDGFGARVVTPRSGIALQNRGACFTLEQGHPNEVGPGKRPMHTIIPAMAMRNGKAFAAFGVMGGAYQPMGHAHVFSNLADHRMDPQEAIDHPRIFWGEDGAVEAESGISRAVREGLVARGHRVRDAALPLGGGQVIVIDHENGFLVGGTEMRKDGMAAGW